MISLGRFRHLRGNSLLTARLNASTKRQALRWEKSRSCVSSTFSSEASIASTINLAIDSDLDQAAEAEQLSTPSSVVRPTRKAPAVPVACHEYFPDPGYGPLGNSLPADEELINSHRRSLPLDLDSDIAAQDDTNQRISPSHFNTQLPGMKPPLQRTRSNKLKSLALAYHSSRKPST